MSKNIAIFGARDLFDESDLVAARPQRQKSKVSAFLSDFRDLQVGDYVVHVEHGIGQYQGLKEINQGNGAAEFMVLEYADAGKTFDPRTVRWNVLVPQAPLEAHQQHRWDNLSPKTATHVRLNIYPDGGVARLRLFGRVAS